MGQFINVLTLPFESGYCKLCNVNEESIFQIYLMGFKTVKLKTVSYTSVLARISKMPVQNSNFKTFAPPDLVTYLLQIRIPATFNSLVYQKGQFTIQLCHRRWFLRKMFGYYTLKVKIEKSSWKFLPVQTGGI